VIVEHASHPQFVSNTYLVGDGEGGPAFFIDAGGPVDGLIEKAGALGLRPTHVLLTHHHHDHVCEVGALRKRWPELEVLISPLERDLLMNASPDLLPAAGEGGSGTVDAGQTLTFGALEVRPLHTPGHTSGMLSFLVGPGAVASTRGSAPEGSSRTGRGETTRPGGYGGGPAVVFTGDTLFRNSVGGVRAPGHTSYTDLRDSIMGTLMELPAETIIYPGHAAASTVGEEWESNRFIRVWRGLDPEGSEPCTALGEPATLVLLAEDYDGGTKAWVRWSDGSDDIVPGSRVQRGS
jgi:hydroxyacylglutathione hydrolase